MELGAAREIAERLRASIEGTLIQRDHRLTASFGVTQLEANDDLAILFERIHGRLYQAKLTGRNRRDWLHNAILRYECNPIVSIHRDDDK